MAGCPLFCCELPMSVKGKVVAVGCALLLLAGCAHWFVGRHVNIAWRAAAQDEKAILAGLKLPPGYAVDFFAPPGFGGLDAPRQLSLGDDGWIFSGSRAGKVYALRDTDGDGRANEIRIVAEGGNIRHSVAYHQNNLYLGAIDRVYAMDDIRGQLAEGGALSSPRVLIDNLNPSSHHGARHLEIGADGMLYLSLGTPCNTCLPPKGTGVIRRYAPPFSPDSAEVAARGVRNSVGFAFHPKTGEMWFTDNGSDFLGDELPHDELNRVPSAGLHFGYPFCHQGDLLDPEFGAGKTCADYEPPVLKTGPHVANLGAAFDADGDYIYLALHGSWNRSEKIGYAVWRAKINAAADSVENYEPFVEGWLRNGGVSGRPVDVLFLENGDMLVSDDFADSIYRIRKTDGAVS